MRTRQIRRSLAAMILLLAVSGQVAISAAPAGATAVPGGAGSIAGAGIAQVESDVAALLRLHPDARRIDMTSVQVDEGVVITVPPAAQRRAAGATASGATMALPLACAVGWLCLWEHSWWRGNRISFYYCNSYNLFDYFMPNGRHWADQLSSYANAQLASTALFYNWVGHWDLLFFDRPGAGNADLSLGYRNDMVDMVDPC